MLCATQKDFTAWVPAFLERGRRSRVQYREETITDLFRDRIYRLPQKLIRIEIPIEHKTGADMEWIFFDAKSKSHFRVFVQAKRETPKNKSWRTRGYSKLDHMVAGQHQYDLMLNTCHRSSAAFPIYLFYQYQSTLDQARAVSPPKLGSDQLLGVNWTPAWIVKYLLEKRAHPSGAKRRGLKAPHPKRHEHLARYFSSLSDFFCAPQKTIPNPRHVRRSLVNYQSGFQSLMNEAGQPSELLDVPDISEENSPDIRRMIESDQPVSYLKSENGDQFARAKILLISNKQNA